MVRFGCRDLSLVSVASSSTLSIPDQSNRAARPAQRTDARDPKARKPSPSGPRRLLSSKDKGKGKGKATKKTRSHMNKETKAKVQDAQKKERVKANRISAFEPCWAYVGNLHPAVTVAQLTKIFKPCGRVLDVSIRISRGCIAAQAKDYRRALENRDRGYATIEFASTFAAVRALKLDGTTLNGIPMVVCLHAGDLPEASEIRDSRKEQQLRGGRYKANSGGLWQRLTRKTTERIRSPDDPKAKPLTRNTAMGMSFPLTII